MSRQEQAKQQQEINDYIQSVKSRMLLGRKPSTLSLWQGKKLKWAIMTGSEAEARVAQRNSRVIIFFASANDLDAIKIRAMEFAVVISRAALEGGAEASSDIAEPKLISSFFVLDTIRISAFGFPRCWAYGGNIQPDESHILTFCPAQFVTTCKITEDVAQHVMLRRLPSKPLLKS